MSKHGIKGATIALAALAQETRLAISGCWWKRAPKAFPPDSSPEPSTPPATLSFHLKELAHAGLAHARPEGRFVFYSADFERMAALMTVLTRNCCKGMPHECLETVETALSRCCTPAQRPPTRSRP